MFPELENYDSKDMRSLILYSWHFELYALKSLIENTNNNINEKIKINIQNAQSMITDMEAYDASMREVQVYHSIAPLAFQSYLLTLYSIIEAAIDRYCSICEKHMNLKVKLIDLKDKGITRGINFLEKVVEVEKIKFDSTWGKMKVINDLRNDLIHRCGAIGKSNNKDKYLAQLGVEVIDGKIAITYENIMQIYEYVEEFMQFVFTRDFTNKDKTLKKEEKTDEQV